MQVCVEAHAGSGSQNTRSLVQIRGTVSAETTPKCAHGQTSGLIIILQISPNKKSLYLQFLFFFFTYSTLLIAIWSKATEPFTKRGYRCVKRKKDQYSKKNQKKRNRFSERRRSYRSANNYSAVIALNHCRALESLSTRKVTQDDVFAA